MPLRLLVVGAGVEQTLALRARSNEPAAAEAAEYLTRCAASGDFDDLEGWLASRRSYFD